MIKEKEDAPSKEEDTGVTKHPPTVGINRNWVDQFYEEVNQVLHRFNYFLVATSFMFLAFVSLITSYKSGDFDWIIKSVTILGIILSLTFFQINYHQTRVAQNVRNKKSNTPLQVFESGKWIKESFLDLISYPFRVLYFAKERPVSHTWVIPVLFALLWIISLCWWLNNN